MATRLRINRRVTGAAGAPTGLLSAELAYNMVSGVLYVGYGDDGGGLATSVKAITADNFWQHVPYHGGTIGKALISTANGMQWGDLPEGALYTASGNGIELTGTEFSLNYTEVATGIGLGNYVTSSGLTTILGDYSTSNDIATILEDYVLESDLTTTLSGYATDTELTNGLAGKANVTHTHAAADITSGTFDAARIPALDAGKITTGTFADAQIPSLAAGKITSGTFHTDRIPTLTSTHIPALDAGKITTGVLDVARIPVLPGNQTIVSSGAIANLTSGQQDAIAEGTVVTTTDGRRWVYSGAGSKTAEASYIEMADISPEWSVIANKPVFATVATSGSYTDLSNRPTLGTIAAQNANSVAITGGSITGITDLTVADGGTGASNANDARTNLGVAIGSNVQAYNLRLNNLAGLTISTANTIVLYGASNTASTLVLGTTGLALLDDPTANDARITLGLGTMATQNANAVAITGGTIDGVVIDGGTF